jgi:hypothetical protein
MTTIPRYWFRAKRYGWGWGLPLTWEGWSVLAAWLTIFIAAIPLFQLPQHRVVHALFIVGMLAALLAVCFWKGEPARWRQGD